jgi:hypothetical protein
MIKYIDLVHLYVLLHHPKELTEPHYKTKDFHHPLQRHQLMKYLAVIVELIAVAVVVIVRMEMLRLAAVSAAAAQAHLAQ